MNYPNKIPNPIWRRLEIEDDSDCGTCQRRNKEQMAELIRRFQKWQQETV